MAAMMSGMGDRESWRVRGWTRRGRSLSVGGGVGWGKASMPRGVGLWLRIQNEKEDDCAMKEAGRGQAS